MFSIDLKNSRRLKNVVGFIFLYFVYSLIRGMIIYHYFKFINVFYILGYLIMIFGCFANKDRIIGTGALIPCFLYVLTSLYYSYTSEGLLFTNTIYGYNILRVLAFLMIWRIAFSQYKINFLTRFLPVVLMVSYYYAIGYFDLNSLFILAAIAILCLSITEKGSYVAQKTELHPFLKMLVELIGSFLPILVFALLYNFFPEKMHYFFGPSESSDSLLLFAVDFWSRAGAPFMLAVSFFVSAILNYFITDEAETLGECIISSLLIFVIISIVCCLLYFVVGFLFGISPIIGIIFLIVGIFAAPTIPVVQLW